MADVNGYCDPRFDRVQQLLADNVAAGREVGASLYVSINGEPVIDLWGGWRDKDHSGPWTQDMIVNVFSASKTVTSLAVLMLADRGELDLFAPVADYWPEFAQNGKEKAQVRHLLSHTVGLPAWEPPFDLALAMDMEGATARLAAQAPWWEPGTRGSYHASSFGHLNAELVRRVTGKKLSRFIADEITGPLDADFYLGLADDMFGRVATVYPAEQSNGPNTPEAATAPADPDDGLAVERDISIRTRLGSFSGQKRDAQALFNSPEWRRTEFGGSTGHANARGLGRIMTVLSNGGVSRGVKLLSRETISMIFQEQFRGIDSYYMKPIRWGLGYALAPLEKKERGPLPFMRPSPRTCYWYGTGGSLSIADAEHGIALSYVMNQCQFGAKSLNGVYYNAIYDCL
ncbi:serine hydrolase [Sphingobium sp. H39-3-25]|uniref:serine hydrolase domain-containing protein n=1 Tax=Sphingobium arseniciresistens TaxID=3030834 RepID=UPI0023B98E6A|nr:serine hydrolase [Sphingobium arseniciresistens]